MWMVDPHVISALREKRALVAGLIEKLQRKLEQHRADLTHNDGLLRLFQPDRDPGEIKPRRTYARRTRYFARNELSRLTMDALRAADGALVTTAEIVGHVIKAKGFDATDAALRSSIRDQVLTLLRSFRKQHTVAQIGLGRGSRWKVANGAQRPARLSLSWLMPLTPRSAKFRWLSSTPQDQRGRLQRLPAHPSRAPARHL
jgi:hypothetical protein